MRREGTECVNLSFSGAFKQSNSKRTGVVAMLGHGFDLKIACFAEIGCVEQR